ncbi:hypothetical protein HDU93_007779 [Gonapodya sp. JEL0774]|nr:hypothetical protein HDU93_007779 [Gonapodya sp. JEL0774]
MPPKNPRKQRTPVSLTPPNPPTAPTKIVFGDDDDEEPANTATTVDVEEPDPESPPKRMTRARAAAQAKITAHKSKQDPKQDDEGEGAGGIGRGEDKDEGSGEDVDDEDEGEDEDEDEAPEAVTLSSAKVQAMASAKGRKAEVEKIALEQREARRKRDALFKDQAKTKVKPPKPSKTPKTSSASATATITSTAITPASSVLAPLSADLLASLAQMKPSSTASSVKNALASVDPLGGDLGLGDVAGGRSAGHTRFDEPNLDEDLDLEQFDTDMSRAARAGLKGEVGELRMRHSRLDDVDLGSLLDGSDGDETESDESEDEQGLKVYGKDGKEEGDDESVGVEEDGTGAKRRKVGTDGSVKVGAFIARPLSAPKANLPSAPFLRLPPAPSAATYLTAKLRIEAGKTAQARLLEAIAKRGGGAAKDGKAKEKKVGHVGPRTQKEKKKDAKKQRREREKQERSQYREERARLPALMTLVRPLALTSSRLPTALAGFVSRPGGVAAKGAESSGIGKRKRKAM